MVKNSEELWYNGHSSLELGIVNVNVSDGMLEEPFLAPRRINKEKIRWRDKPYFYGIEEDVKTFELTLALSDEALENARMDKTHLRNIAHWLRGNNEGYKELWFSEDCELDEYGDYDITQPKRIYFAIMIGSSSLHHFGLEEGYLNVTFEVNSPYCYSRIKGGDTYEIGVTNDGESFEDTGSFINFFNHGDLPIKPEISIINKTPNEKILLGLQPITNELMEIDKEANRDRFKRTIELPKTDYSKFKNFEISEGKKAKGSFNLLGTVYDGETFSLGNNTYEFDLGDNQTKNKNDKNNILVSINDGKKASNTLVFENNSNIKDASTVTIGDLQFEYDWNNIVSSTSEKVDISQYVENAKGTLNLNSNPIDGDEVKLGDTTYTLIGGTNEEVIKVNNHMLTDGTESNFMVSTSRKNLTQDKVNINTKTLHNIKDCLVRNITKNPSDLGIRKMEYLNQNFVMVLWDGESDQNFDEEIENVGVNSSLVVSFDEALDTSTVNDDTIKVTDAEGIKIPVKFSVNTNNDNRILYVAPQGSYNFDTDYFLYVSKGVKDIKGNNYKQIRKIKFHTKSKDAIDSNEYENVSAVKVFNIYSSNKLNSSTVNNTNVYVKDESNNNVEIDMFIENEGKAIAVAPKTKYENGKKYILTISSNVKDIDGNSITNIDKTIKFKVQNSINTAFIDEDCYEVLTGRKINEPIVIVLPKEISSLSVVNSIIMCDKNNNKINTYVEVDASYKQLLKVSFAQPLNYNSIYYLYISNSIKYVDDTYLDNPRKYKIITQTEDDARGINNNETNLTPFETGDKNKIQKDYRLVNTDKEFSINLPNPVDKNTVNSNNIYVLDSKGNKVDVNIDISSANTTLKIFPNPVWKSDESYRICVTTGLKSSNKPRVFAGHVEPDVDGNKSDYENALEIFTPLNFDIIKTNGFKYQNNKIVDLNGNEVNFTSTDIIIGGNYGLKPQDYNADGTLIDGTILVNIPQVIFLQNVHRIIKEDRVATKEAMKKYVNKIKNTTWTTQSMYNIDKTIINFTTKSKNEHISIDIDDSIILGNNVIAINEKPKKIKGMIAGDDIEFYENTENMDFTVDNNMMVKLKVPNEAKAYATKDIANVASTFDDFTNAQLLKQIGYEIVDTSTMTLEEKKKIQFKDGDLVIGGFFAGSKPSDYDDKGNLKTTPPQDDDPNDIRKERISGIPNINIYPAKRLEGSAENPGRDGTKKAIEDYVNLTKQAQTGKLINTGAQDNISGNGVTLKYKVPKNATVYGTGIDIYNVQRYLSGMGFKFVNVGNMTLDEKRALPFKPCDIVVGDTGASDNIKENGTEKVVTGIPNININGATRLGGKDRYETEAIIKEYASTLKVKGIEIGDILKLKIVTSDTVNTALSQTDSTSTDNINGVNAKTKEKIEYHRVKNIKTLNRGRIFIQFTEDIRTISYIKSIETLNLYKLFDVRKADDCDFSAPYQIKIGYQKDQTIKNIIKAINDTGTQGIEYSIRTFKNKIVLAQKLNDNQIQVQAIEAGSKGNISVNMLSKFDTLNRFLTSTLTGGCDCCESDAIVALAKAIQEVSKREDRRNKDRYTCTYDSNSITVTHVLYGEKYNNIICLANVGMEEYSPYLIMDSVNLVNLHDFLQREKQVAKWANHIFVNGKDPFASACVSALKKSIEDNQKDELTVTYITKEDNTVDFTALDLEYKEFGGKGNIPLNTTCVNGMLSSKKFMGGVDGLEENEEIIINSENREIKSSTGKDRYKNYIGGDIIVPLNGVIIKNLNTKSSFTLTFRYRETYFI